MQPANAEDMVEVPRHGLGPTRGGIRLAPGIRVGCQSDRKNAVLWGPGGGKVPLNLHALMILELCDGSRSRDRVAVDAIVRSAGGMRAPDVLDFLNAAESRGWVIDPGSDPL